MFEKKYKDLKGGRLPPVAVNNARALENRFKTICADATCISPHNRELHALNKSYPYYGLVEINVGRCNFLMLSNNDDNVAKIYFHYGPDSYETLSTLLFAELSRSSETIFDIGAYTGLFGMVAAKINENASVYLFEPLQHLAERISVNSRINGLANVEVISKAVSEKDGFSSLIVYGPNLSTTGASLRHKAGIKSVSNIEVETVSIDSILNSLSSGPSLIKLDTEKDEINALHGAHHTIKSYKPILFIEVLDQSSLVEVVVKLEVYNYRFGFIDDYNKKIVPVAKLEDDQVDFTLKHYGNLLCYHFEEIERIKAALACVVGVW